MDIRHGSCDHLTVTYFLKMKLIVLTLEAKNVVGFEDLTLGAECVHSWDLQSRARNFPCKTSEKVGKLRASWKIMSMKITSTGLLII